MLLHADARALPLRNGEFDLIFTSPPWDNLGVLLEARSELMRVLRPKGKMLLVLPHLDSKLLATLVVANRDWTERVSYVCPKPSRAVGPKYHSPNPLWVSQVLHKFHVRSVLDPFCGTGTIPRVAGAMRLHAVGCDIDREALAA